MGNGDALGQNQNQGQCQISGHSRARNVCQEYSNSDVSSSEAESSFRTERTFIPRENVPKLVVKTAKTSNSNSNGPIRIHKPPPDSATSQEARSFWTTFMRDLDKEIEMEKKSDDHINFGPSGGGQQPINPFYHRPQFTLYDRIKIALLTVTIFPIRILLVILTMCLAYVLGRLAVLGVSFEESQKNPLPPWRSFLKHYVTVPAIRLAFFWAGFHWVSVKGKRVKASEAPIYVVASHTSLFDALYALFLGPPAIVARADTRNIPIFGNH